MCGIVGYVGSQPAVDVAIDGLRRLEYRGYDSAGIAVVTDSGLLIEKKAGKLINLIEAVDDGRLSQATTGIGHTRWATHGGPSDRNAHPHLSFDGKVAVIHNGIIENFAMLRAGLEAEGIDFSSDTDTECVAHLLAQAYEQLPADTSNRLAQAMRVTCQRLTGAFTLLAVHCDSPGTVVGARRNSPLVVGQGEGENFLGSDVSAFIAHTKQAIELGQDQVVELTADSITITDFSGAPSEGKPYEVNWDASAAEKGGYEFFMQKEIFEQPQAISDTLRGRLSDTGRIVLDEIRISDEDLRDIDKVFVIACGTSYHAGMIAKYAIEHWVRIPCEVELASEFRYRDPVLDRSTLVISISQSGETMDTLMALRHAKEQKARVLAIANVNGSTIPRESDAVLYTRAGPEVAVASTKSLLTQLIAVYILGLYLAQVKGVMYEDEVQAAVNQLQALPQAVSEVLDTEPEINAIAQLFSDAQQMLFIGRHVGYPAALEGALKLKELAYMHAEGFAAGELKHGPISLIDEGTPVVVVLPSPRSRRELHGKVVSNIQEVRARGAKTILIAEYGDTECEQFADHIIRIPRVPALFEPVVAIVPLQILACQVAASRGLDVDQPRNLAKSVTVE